MVVNVEGFVKYSSILQGNIADFKTLGNIVDNLSTLTSLTGRKSIVVIDAGIATMITWSRKPSTIYFLRTNLQQTNEEMMWNIYNTISEIEATFRTLKSDLSLRPVFHQKDETYEAHLYLGVLAYTVVNTIRYKLKSRGIHHDWQNIVRIMNTQKAGTIIMNKRNNKKINIRVCSMPTAGAQEIYSATGYKPMPFYRKIFVLPE